MHWVTPPSSELNKNVEQVEQATWTIHLHKNIENVTKFEFDPTISDNISLIIIDKYYCTFWIPTKSRGGIEGPPYEKVWRSFFRTLITKDFLERFHFKNWPRFLYLGIFPKIGQFLKMLGLNNFNKLGFQRPPGAKA